MSELLDKTVAQIKQLPKDRQDAIAAFILEEIEDEARWDAAFAKSPEVLERLAEEAEAEDQQGQTEELNPDALLSRGQHGDLEISYKRSSFRSTAGEESVPALQSQSLAQCSVLQASTPHPADLFCTRYKGLSCSGKARRQGGIVVLDRLACGLR